MIEILKQRQELNEKWLKLADKLDELQASKNDGRGVSHVRTIVAFLRAGRINEARAVCMNEGDKMRSYPDILELVNKELFDGEPSPYSNWHKKRMKEIEEEDKLK